MADSMTNLGNRYPATYPGQGEGAFRVLHEDNHVLGVFKPIGIPCQQGREGVATILDLAKAYLKEKYAKPGNVFMGLVHRLDQPVSGVLVLAKTSKGASRLSEQFRERTVTKVYRAWVEGVPKSDADRLVTPAGDGGKEKSLEYRVLERVGNFAKVEVVLGTGRKHQIREQLAGIGHPILGDTLYGAKPRNRGEILLVAKRLTFRHPTNEQQIELILPDEWDLVSLTSKP